MKHTSRLVLTLLALAVASTRLSSRGVLLPIDPCGTGGNAIACENTQPGSPSTEWDVSGAGDPSIQGFATDISVNRGSTVHFKVDTDATAYRIDIYRLGYYGGSGARKMATVLPSAALPQAQPACLVDASTGLIDCGNWQESAAWAVPGTAVSGVYVAKLTRTDTGGASHIVFIVRDDSSHSALLFQTSDTTWQAYNQYGGNSLYAGGPATNPGRALKVSYNRPFTTRGTSPEDWVFNAEYPMIRWLEQNGYDVTYTTGVDTDRRGALLSNHDAFLSVGHDEYWSGGQRANVEAARAAGVNLAFFSGNEIFWKTRWEPSIDGTSTDHRTLVCYKETHANAKIDPLPDVWTGTWRDPRFSPPADGGRPENALTGTLFMVNAGSTTAIQVPSAYSQLRFWRNTAIASLAPGTTATLAPNTLGYEWDEAPAANAPDHLIRLSSTTVNVGGRLLDYGSTYGGGTATHSLTLYRDASSHALVFGAGTVQWSWGLDPIHDGSGGAPTSDLRMRQATINLFTDMGVQPATPQSDVVVSDASADTLAPTSTITAPANGASFPQGSAAVISGTAADAGGGIVAGVEVSTDGGTTWRLATGTTNWTFAWSPSAMGSATILSRAFDDTGNVETPAPGVTVTVTAAVCPCSLWSPATVPAIPDTGPDSAVELGVKFYADVAGTVSGVRFYKGAGNTDTHVGSLWSADGTLLGNVTFTGETASGWQTATFNAPIAIQANTLYVVSYHTNVGHYAADDSYFATTGVDTGHLHAPADNLTPNGVFHYGSTAFPTDNYMASNYWVDVLFTPAGTQADTQAPTSAIASPANGAALVQGTATAITGTATDSGGGTVARVDVSTDGGASWQPANGTTNWSFAWTPTATGTQVIRSRAVDNSGNVEVPAAGVQVTVNASSSGGTGTCPCSLWPSSTVPSIVDAGDQSAVELGVKFSSDVAGYVTGVRFYKSSLNTGTHVGSLWTTTGTRLGSVTFTAESPSGWQTAQFASPIAIGPNTTYVVSYHTDAGHYSYDNQYFASATLNSPPLHAPANTLTANGVYQYTSTSAFPTNTFNAGNYWVDLVFSPTAADTTPPQIISTTPGPGAAGVSATAPVSATFGEPLNPATVNGTSVELRKADNSLVSATVTYDSTAERVILTPAAALPYSSTFTMRIRGGAATPHVTDMAGNPLAADYPWTFTTSAPPPPPPDQGPGGPILVVAGSSNPFGKYYAEILRNEGLNEFAVRDLGSVTSMVLAGYDIVVLGETPLTSAQVSMFTTWVNGGGKLIAMRPDKQLASLLGLSSTSNTLSDQYLLINTASGPGAGLVSQTIQFHGTADLYSLAGATSLGTLYSSATTATSSPAASLRTVGSSGGQAAAFTYDLARSIVYTRQGNPAWAGQERDGAPPVRSDDMFFGGTQKDWIDFNKIQIPQADEQQRLFAKLVVQMEMGKKPLPRFWYLPRSLKAAVVMTGDDHGNGATAGRFDTYIAASPAGCSVDDWQCIRGTSYMYTSVPLTNADVTPYQSLGFELGLHVTTNCGDFTSSTLPAMYSTQLAEWTAKFPGLTAPVTNRTHCIPWSDWSTQASVEYANGIRLDTDYYYWPDTWVKDRPGLFTGSGMPMRFAALDGTMIDVYQAATQMTDESGLTYATHINTLLDNALGAPGYFVVVTANMHTDQVSSAGSDAIIASAQAHGVPVVSAKQMLTWLDGRNGSSFKNLSWSGNQLTFAMDIGQGARGLTVMLPASANGAPLLTITANGTSVAFTRSTIKGTDYAVFPATGATYVASYQAATPDTTITSRPASPTNARTATFSFTSTVSGSTFQCSLDGAAYATCSSGVTYSSLAGGTHTFNVRAVAAGVTDPTPASASWTIDITAPVISALTAAPSTTTATITWTTNEASDSTIDYGLSSSSLSSHATSASLVTSHSLSLSGLSSATTYYYRVTSRDAAGNAASAPSSTTTATFKTATPLITTTKAPASVSVQTGSTRSGSASSLSSNDGSMYSVNSTTSGGSRTATWYASFTSVPSTLSNLTITYSGQNSRSVTQNIEIYRWSTSSWVTLDTRTVGSSEVQVSGLVPSGTLSTYLSSSGEMRVRIRAVGSSSSFYSSGDFMQIKYDHP